MNSSQTEHRICNQNKTDFNISENNCENICIKDCNEIYFSTRFDNSLVLNTTETKISIKYRNSDEFHYIAENKYNFVDYMSNIGGLFGLWFGITFIDMSQLIKAFLRRLNLLILYYINFAIISRLFARFKRLRNIKILLDKIRAFASILENMNLRRFIHIISFPIIIYQLWKLMDNYLKYGTEVSVEWIPYRNSENRLKIEEGHERTRSSDGIRAGSYVVGIRQGAIILLFLNCHVGCL